MVYYSRPVTQSHVGRQGEDIVSLLNKLPTRDRGAYVPTSPRTSLNASTGAPRKLSPMIGMGQCLARHVSQGAKEWSGVDHQDMLMCPRQQSEGDVTSVTQTAELGHVRWILDHTPVISKEKPRSRGVHACGVNDAFRRSTSKEPLEDIRPVRVTFQG